MTTNAPRVIELTKGPADDALMKRILVQWYQSSRSVWMKTLEWVVTGFFTAATVFFMARGQDMFAWMSLAGLVVCAFLLFGYVPWLAHAALKVSKKSPSYNEIKYYRFSPGRFWFRYGSEKAVEGPLGAFDEARVTRDALLLIGGGRLALWLSRADLTGEELDTLILWLRQAGVRVTGERVARRMAS